VRQSRPLQTYTDPSFSPESRQVRLNHHAPDRQFLTNATDRRDYIAVLLAIVQLAHNLGMTVTAEGLEQIDQVVMLQALNCDQGQGYFFTKPMHATDAEAYLVEPAGRVALSA